MNPGAPLIHATSVAFRLSQGVARANGATWDYCDTRLRSTFALSGVVPCDLATLRTLRPCVETREFHSGTGLDTREQGRRGSVGVHFAQPHRVDHGADALGRDVLGNAARQFRPHNGLDGVRHAQLVAHDDFA